MGMKIWAIGGYSEVGRNMTAVDIDGDIVILDMGLFMPAVIGLEEEQEKLSVEELQKVKAIPDDSKLIERKADVKAIVIGHAHLDHVGATPYLCNKYKAPIMGTPFTINLLKRVIKDKGRPVNNKLISLNVGSSRKITKDLEVEFANMTHSTAQCTAVILHTKYGKLVYCLDFKLDNNPTLGKKPDYNKLGNLKDVKCLILDSLDSKIEGKTPSETVAKDLLKEVLLDVDHSGKAVFVTAFSSHIARLKSISEFGKKMGRKVVFLGRSLNKYVGSAKDAKVIDMRDVEIIAYRAKIAKKLNLISKNPDKYLIVCTGNQGEKNAVLSRLARGEFKFSFRKGDSVIFSCRTIPVEENIKDREKLENNLKSKGVRLFLNIHASGHPHAEDNLELMKLVKAEHVIPAHGDHKVVEPGAKIAESIGYELGKTVHILKNGQILEL